MAEGTQDGCLVDPREVFGAALAVRASMVVLAHSHPGGGVKPSEHDVILTRQAVEAGQLIGIPVVDHLVVGPGRYLSMAERGLCDF